MYLKVTNAEENHHGLQYHDGLNIDPVPFAREGSCCSGGIYFTTPEYIHCFLGMGIYVREVTIPEDAEMVKDPSGDKWRASKVILRERRDIREVGTWKWLVESGVNVNECLLFTFRFGKLDIIRYLVENVENIHWNGDYFLRYAEYIEGL